MKETQKDPAMLGGSGYERLQDDFYPTIEAAWIVPVLLRHVRLRGPVWEPACGEGHLSKVLIARGLSVVSSDLHHRGYGRGGMDFLATTTLPDGCVSVITNPPYVDDMIERFVRHALALTEPVGGACAFLVRNEYDAAKGRKWMFRHPAFSRKIVLTKRPRWVEKDKSSASPRHTYAWLVWDWMNEGEPRICWGGPEDV